jgi:putative membrane protein
MKRLTRLALSIVLAGSVLACRGEHRETTDRTATGTGAVGTAGASVDRDFIADLAENGRAEIELGKMAAERASSPRVKDFAQMLVRDHTKAAADLRDVAAAANVQLDTASELDRDHENLQKDLAKLSGQEFDRKYVDAMVDGHEKAVSEIEKKVDSDNPQLKQWATQTLPVVRQHLERAKQLKETLEKANS